MSLNGRQQKPHRGTRPRQSAITAPLRRIGVQFAALAVGSLCALVLALGIVTYLITQHTLLESMQTSLRERANGPPIRPLVTQVAHSDRPLPRPPRPQGSDHNPDDIHMTIADQQMKILVGDVSVTKKLLDLSAAQKALRSGKPLFSDVQISGDQSYLLYSTPIRENGRITGVAQFSLSKRQYNSSMQALIRGLLAVGVLGLLASAGISGVLMRRALRPIRTALQHQRDFVADAAHELRTPLAIMRTATELGLNAETVSELQDALAQTQRQNSHLTRLVDDLSLLARADSGAVRLDLEPLDLAQLVVESAAGIKMLAEDRGLQMSIETEKSIWVCGDAGRLQQLLLILLDNALKYAPQGGTIVVTVQRHSGQAHMYVADNGRGIDREDLPHIFDRFYRADHARSTEGTGLGLAIGRWIAEAHGGHILAANAPGHGAEFTVTIPLIR